MQGIRYVNDDHGVRKGVLIDLDIHGKLWEDFYDNLVAQARSQEKRIAWEEVKT